MMKEILIKYEPSSGQVILTTILYSDQ